MPGIYSAHDAILGVQSALGGRGGGLRWLLRDEFTTDRAAGAVDGTAAEPGPGTRGVTDLDSRITIASGLLSIAAAGTAGDRTAYWLDDAITRVAGQVVAFSFVSPAGGGNTIQFGAGNAKAASLNNHINIGLRYLGGATLLARATTPGISPKIATTTVGTTHRVYQVLRAVGKFVFMQVGGVTKFLWSDEWDATPTLYFSIVLYDVLASNYDSVRVLLPRYTFSMSTSDSFNRANGTPGTTDGYGHAEANSGSGVSWADQVGNATISSNALVLSTLSGGVGIVTVDTGNTDEYLCVKATRNAGNVGVVTRYVDSDNYICVYHDGTDFKLDKVVAGSVTNLASKTITYAAAGKLRIRCDGTNVWAWYDGQSCDMEPITVADAALQTGTKHGVYSTDTGNTFDDWFTVPVNGYSDLGAC